MELQFEKSTCRCLGCVLHEVRTLEQAQEIRLSEGMPDIGRVLGSWGQVLQRSKQWTGDSVSLTAGMLVWVLYAPEDGSKPRWVEGWIPMELSWDLNEPAPEGRAQIQCLTRFVDARSVSARKLMVRAGLSASIQAWVPQTREVCAPQDPPEHVELKKVKYPLRLPKEAGEKIFSLEEDLTLPGSAQPMEQPVYFTLTPAVQEQKVLGDKVVFKGAARLHLLYEGTDSRLHSWDFQLPFSQFGELEEARGEESDMTAHCAVTSLEVQKQDESHLHVKCGLTGQYVVSDLEALELMEDAYSPCRELTVQQDHLELPAILDQKRDAAPVELTVPGTGELSVDVCFCPDFPRQKPEDTGFREELSGIFQILYEAPDGTLQGASARWEGSLSLNADSACRISAEVLPGPEPQILMGGDDMKVRTELPMALTVTAGAGIPMVTGLDLGDPREPDENRPSLILRRAVTGDLWEIAKHTGSTVDAIRSANHLQEDAAPGQMLLIPIL